MPFQQVNAPVKGIVPNTTYHSWIEGQTGDGWYGWWVGAIGFPIILTGLFLLGIFVHPGWFILYVPLLIIATLIIVPGVHRIRAMKRNRYLIIHFHGDTDSYSDRHSHLYKDNWYNELRGLAVTRDALLDLAKLPSASDQLSRAANEIAVTRWQLANVYRVLEPFIRNSSSQPKVVNTAIETRYNQLLEANRDAKELLSMGTELAFRTVQLGANDRHLGIFFTEFETQVQAMRELAEITEAAWVSITTDSDNAS